MLTDENLKALLEAIIYVAPEPVTLNALLKALEGEERERVKEKLRELTEEFDRPEHGIQIRQIAGGYKFSSKPEHHEVLRKFVKSLKQPIRLSKPALETLAVIAYRQPVTAPEIDEIRGVDCGGVIHTLLERKLVVTAGRKNVVGRPILYRTSRDFLVHFGLKDLSELPSLREFEEMARQALGPELPAEESAPAAAELLLSESSQALAEAESLAASAESEDSSEEADSPELDEGDAGISSPPENQNLE
jgi:segregation and condensation protein B